MFGLDERIVELSSGSSVALIILVGIMLGLRHAIDPDHLAALTTLVASGRDRAAGRLGAWWGLGHAITLAAFGLPVVLFGSHLPGRARQAAELAVAALIVFLAARLIVRWRRGAYHVHDHAHSDGTVHVHLRPHAGEAQHGHPHGATRTPVAAFGIGLLHGVGGSAGVSVLVLASVDSRLWAVASLVLLGLCTLASMWLVTTGFGRAFFSRRVRDGMRAVTPALATLSLGFGVWYGMGVFDAGVYPI